MKKIVLVTYALGLFSLFGPPVFFLLFGVR